MEEIGTVGGCNAQPYEFRIYSPVRSVVRIFYHVSLKEKRLLKILFLEYIEASIRPTSLPGSMTCHVRFL